MPPHRIFLIENSSDALIVIPQGDVSSLEENTVQSELRAILALLPQATTTHLVVDLARAPFFGSTMLGSLIKLWHHVDASGGKMALCNASDFVVDVLNATKLDTVWPVFKSRPEAEAALSA